MIFKAKFVSPKPHGVYWLTIRADGVNEATKLAERQCRKGFQLALVKEYDNECN